MLRLAALAAVVLAGLSMPARGDDAADIRATLGQWKDDFNAGKVEAVCGLFATDVIAQVQGQPERNHAEVCAVLQKALANPKLALSYDLDIKEILLAGDVAIVRLVWTLSIGAPVVETSVETGMDIFRRQPEGSWKIIRFISYDAP